MAANQERTFIMIKPDGVHRGLVGEIIKRFERVVFPGIGVVYGFARLSPLFLVSHA